MPPLARAAPLDRALRPVHQWVWSDVDRRIRKLLAFGGSRDGRRARYPPRRRGHPGSPLATPVPRARGRRAASRRSLPANAAPRCSATRCGHLGSLFNATRFPVAMGSTIWRSMDEPDHRCSPSSTWPRSRGRPLHHLPGTRRRRSGDTRDLRSDPARRSVSHELHVQATPRVSPHTYRRLSGGRAPRGSGSGTCVARPRSRT